MQREKELMSGLRKIGLVKGEATLDDVLGLKVNEVLEKRLQTLVLRKGMANTSNQARQFIVHGHVAILGKRISAPSYLVPVGEASEIRWANRKILIDEKPKKDLKKSFEEAKGEKAKEFAEALPPEEEGKTGAGGEKKPAEKKPHKEKPGGKAKGEEVSEDKVEASLRCNEGRGSGC